MSHIRCLGAVVVVLTLAGATPAGDKQALPTGEKAPPRVLRIGAVAYAPSAVTVFENLRRYFAKTDLPIDYVLYSNYDALVDALRNGQVDIAWNTPLAHARYHLSSNGQSQTLVMRDVDCDFRCKLLVRQESGIKALIGLQGFAPHCQNGRLESQCASAGVCGGFGGTTGSRDTKVLLTKAYVATPVPPTWRNWSVPGGLAPHRS